MLFGLRTPREPLSYFVETFWFHEGHVSTHSMERLLPDGGIELIFDLTGTPKHVYSPVDLRTLRTYRGSWISGQQSGQIIIEAAQNSCMYGIRFRPGGFYPFFKAPVSELNDSVVDLDSIWGKFILETRERLMEASTPAERFDLLEEMLYRRVVRGLEPDPQMSYAIRKFMHHGEGLLVKDVAAEIGLSHRQLIRRFDERVGLKPKMLARVFRMNEALRRLQKKPAGSMADVALECGYFDQAHLVHEFQELTRMTPSQYLADRIDDTNFVPVR